VCTVVIRWSPGGPVRLLALRDELVGRAFDDPGEHWRQGVVGGRDRVAGGTWCATDVAAGTTAVVLNRPERRVAAPGASSRGALPLLALEHGEDWVDHVDLTGMASFHLLLVGPDALTGWLFDGDRLRPAYLPEGLHVVTSGGPEDGKEARFRQALEERDWQQLVEEQEPAPDPTALVVRLEGDDAVFATVFGQVMTVRPGRLEVTSSRTPHVPGTWHRRVW
jgi:uncharacterized protein with NRDE domain